MSSDTENQESAITDRRSSESSVVDLEIRIDAPAETVFDFLAVPEKVLRWMGTSGELNPVPGGAYEVHLSADDVAIGRYVDILRPSKISWTWGWRGNEFIPPGSSLVTFELTEVDDATIVRLTHSGLPDVDAAVEHTKGWVYFVPRLAVATAGLDPDCEEIT